ncbi:unnamed protein product [Rotaria magnacalcarata]|uniref:Uncharacterized protein n=1 Tax=Rotaria magnacalcarata TaxID=392030 RepID=A0A814U9P3_9BILA|nr:unnamed protein product [Rotaria magnacalcarata]CAF1682211.1 unnamed protein product [Rotaria magnacalcarata]CAF4419812.1 unnamed protein product [Rotaria magnacalcarata]CAF4475845.1 unnamed protein product [Rotaria magnacalcarata]
MSLANNSSVKKPSSTGTTDSPYLGSKISLVSKAKIRYEGILYTIDANESTVALSKVRSFGTEDRPTDRPVPARDEIFEYIIFRGADIEDLQVREPPQSTLTQDPAIVESSMYPPTGRSTTSGTNSSLGGNQARSSTNQGTMPSTSVQQGPSKGSKSSSNADPLRQLNLNQQQSSRPFSQQSTSAQPEGQDYSYSNNNQRRGRQQQDYYNDFNSNQNNNNRRGNQKYGYSDWSRTNNSAWDNGYRQQQTQRYPRQQQQQQQQQQNYEGNRFYAGRRMNNNSNHNNQQADNYYGYRERRNSTGGITGNPQNQQRTTRQQRERANSIRGNSNSRSTLKFVGDFDFEKSNAEFDKNAIEDEIKKSLSIKTNKDKDDDKSTTEKDKEKENDEPQTPQPPTSSSPTKLEQPQQQDTNPEGYYDKQKSFFDRISCETTEKEKTVSRRNWNEERRINAETFGLKYRPAQQGYNQRNGQGGGGYYNNRRYNAGQQSYYGNGARYQRGGGSGNYGGGQQRGRNTTYYGNTNKRMQAY